MRTFMFIYLCGIYLAACTQVAQEVVVSENVSCSHYIIDDPEYAPNKNRYYRVNFIGIEANEAVALANKGFNPGRIYYKLSKISMIKLPDTPPPYSYREVLRLNHRPGYFTIINFDGTGIQLKEEGVLGAAYSVPDIDDRGRLLLNSALPVLFIRKVDEILIHELAHNWGGKHVFQDGDIDNKGLNCFTGDDIPTTVYIPDISVGTTTCKVYLTEEAEGKYTEKEIADYKSNYLSYSYVTCLNSFMPEQFERFRKMGQINPRIQDCEIKDL